MIKLEQYAAWIIRTKNSYTYFHYTYVRNTDSKGNVMRFQQTCNSKVNNKVL